MPKAKVKRPPPPIESLSESDASQSDEEQGTSQSSKSIRPRGITSIFYAVAIRPATGHH